MNNSIYKLTREQSVWAKRRKQGLASEGLRRLIVKQKGRCALSCAKMVFDKKQGTPEKDGKGVHPLYAAVDHVSPGDSSEFQLVCYALNDLKGHLPKDCFMALAKTKPWRRLMRKWKQQSERAANNRSAFRNLLRRPA